MVRKKLIFSYSIFLLIFSYMAYTFIINIENIMYNFYNEGQKVLEEYIYSRGIPRKNRP